MKRVITFALTIILVLAMAGCSQSGSSAPAATTAAPAAAAPETTAAPAAPAVEKLSGTVSTDGSTSMEKVIGVLK